MVAIAYSQQKFDTPLHITAHHGLLRNLAYAIVTIHLGRTYLPGRVQPGSACQTGLRAATAVTLPAALTTPAAFTAPTSFHQPRKLLEHCKA